MISTSSSLIDKLQNHKNFGFKVKINKSKLIVLKKHRLNIKILDFHSFIINKYKIFGSFFLEQNFKFLEFIAIKKKNETLYIKNEKIKYITREKIRRVVQIIYKEKEKLIEDFRLKELIKQRAQLLYYEQKISDTKEIKEILVKELEKFSKNIQVDKLDDRIVLYTKLNNYFSTLNISYQNLDYRFDKNIYLNYSSKQIKNIIKRFESIDNIEYKNIDEYYKQIENITKSIGIILRKQEKIFVQNDINKMLNIKNVFPIKNTFPVFSKSFENTIENTSRNILQLIQKNVNTINTQEIESITQNINETIQRQLSFVYKNIVINSEYKNIVINSEYKNIVINSEYKNIFVEDLKTIFLNTNYTFETKINEINNSINSFISNIIVENQTKQNFKIESIKIIEDNIYEQSIKRLINLDIYLNFKFKNQLLNIIKKQISKIENIDSDEKFYMIVNNSIAQFLSIQNTMLNNIQVKVESIYENIVKEIKRLNHIKSIPSIQRSQILKSINRFLTFEDITEFENIFEVFTKSIMENYTIDKKEEIEKILEKNISEHYIIDKKIKIQNILEKNLLRQKLSVENTYKNIVNIYKAETTSIRNIQDEVFSFTKLGDNVIITSAEKKVEALYKRIIGEIKQQNSIKQINVEQKTLILNSIKNIVKLDSINQINKKYKNLLNQFTKNIEYKNIIDKKEKVDIVYGRVVSQIKHIQSLKNISSIDKTYILQRVQSILKYDSLEKINIEYKKIINEYINKTKNESELVQNDFKVEDIYKNVVKQIIKNTTNKYISIIDKKELFKKITNISKLSNMTQINKAYQNLTDEYKINRFDISSKTTLGENILVIKNKEQKVEVIYQNIIKDIKAKVPLRQINIMEKSKILANVEKLIKLNNMEQINKEYQQIVEQFVSHSKIKESVTESIIKKLIGNTNTLELESIDNTIVKTNKNTLVKNVYKTKTEHLKEKDSFVYINADELKRKKEQKSDQEVQSVDYKLNKKQHEFSTNINNIYEDFSENIDELALKIFRDIKDELSMEYKRI